MRVPLPIVVSFSTSEPRPTTTLSAISTRSRTHDWSPRMQSAPIVEPAKTLPPVAVPAHEAEELLALEAERLGGVDLRDVDVAGTRLPLAVRLGALPG